MLKMTMNVRKYFVWMVVSLMILCECDNGGKNSSCVEGMGVAGEDIVAASDVAGGGVITLEKKSAHRSCVLKIGGEDRTVSFAAEMEYPMHFGIPKQEYRNLTKLVDEMFNNGTNFEVSVENVFSNLVESVKELSANEADKSEENYRMAAQRNNLQQFRLELADDATVED